MSKSKLTILITCVICILAVLMSGFIGASQVPDNTDIIPVYMNGLRVTDGIKVADTTYTPLRAFLNAVDEELEIVWDAETETASVQTDGLDFAVTLGSHYMTANGRAFYIPDGAMLYDDSIIVPLRALAKVFNIEVIWDSETYSAELDTEDIGYLESGDDFYNEEDLYWLSRLINAESGNQVFEGKVAVGNVVLNRVADPTCPDTIHDVVFDKKFGVQFSVTENGTIRNEPNAESVIAAKVCLEGYNIVGDCMFFVNPDIGASAWFLRNFKLVATIGDHDFYA